MVKRHRLRELGVRRQAFSCFSLGRDVSGGYADVKSRMVAEIDKDLTSLPIRKIEKHLVGFAISCDGHVVRYIRRIKAAEVK
jgi:hypothetical protein